MNPRASLLFAAMCACALPSLAKEPVKPAPAAPPVPAEQAQLDYFNGEWRCTGTAFAGPMGPEHKTTATVHAARVVGGRWTHIAYDEDKTAANPTPYHAGLYLGYDAGKKSFVQHCHDSVGGHCTSTSQGWNGDVLVFEGANEGDGKSTPSRETFTRKGPDEVMHSGEMQVDGKWVKLDEETCKKGK